MIRALNVVFIVSTLVGCVTNSYNFKEGRERASRASSLMPPVKASDTAEKIKKDLTRSSYVYKYSERTKKEKAFKNPSQNIRSETRGTVEMHPISTPYLEKLLDEHLQDKAFKEKMNFDEKLALRNKIMANALTQAVVDKAKKRNICFLFSVGHLPGPFNKEHWHFVVEQDGVSKPAQYASKVKKSLSTHSWEDSNGNLQTYTIDHFSVKVCSEAEVDLLSTFAVTIEPRFEKNLEPIKLVWASPKAQTSKK